MDSACMYVRTYDHARPKADLFLLIQQPGIEWPSFHGALYTERNCQARSWCGGKEGRFSVLRTRRLLLLLLLYSLTWPVTTGHAHSRIERTEDR